VPGQRRCAIGAQIDRRKGRKCTIGQLVRPRYPYPPVARHGCHRFGPQDRAIPLCQPILDQCSMPLARHAFGDGSVPGPRARECRQGVWGGFGRHVAETCSHGNCGATGTIRSSTRATATSRICQEGMITSQDCRNRMFARSFRLRLHPQWRGAMGETKMKRLKSMVCAAVISCTLIVPASAQMNSMSSSTKTTTTGMGNMSNTQTHEKMTTHSTSVKPMAMRRHHKRRHNRAVHHTMTKSTTTTTEAK